MFNLAVRWGWRADNPCRGVERNAENKRHRYLSGAEISRLSSALATLPDQNAANAVRLLLLTGARRGEHRKAQEAEMLWVAKAMAREIGASPAKAEEAVAKVTGKSVDALRKQITRMRTKKRT